MTGVRLRLFMWATVETVCDSSWHIHVVIWKHAQLQAFGIVKTMTSCCD